MASHLHNELETEQETATSGEPSFRTLGASKGFKDVPSGKMSDDNVTLSAGAVSLTTPTEHTASLSSSPRSRSSSLASNPKSPETIDDCFLCFLRLQENEELERLVNAYKETQTKLEDEIIILTEKSEASAAEFETLAALYHADQKDLHERLNLLEANNSILETSFIEAEQENAELLAQLQEAEARAKYHTHKPDQSNDDDNEDSSARNDLQERLRMVDDENSRLRRTVDELEKEKTALEECLHRGAQRSRELRKSRRELEEEMSNLKIESEAKTIEYDRRAATSLADINSLQRRVRFLEDENLIMVRSCKDVTAEKDIVLAKLTKAARREEELEAKNLELENEVRRLQEQAATIENNFDSLSALSFEARNDLDEHSKLVEEDNSILQRSFDYLEKENAAFETKLQDAEVRAAQDLALTHKTHVNETKLLRDRIMELVREKGVMISFHENALNLTKVELQEERRICSQEREEMAATQANVALLCQVAEASLMEQSEIYSQLHLTEREMHERTERFEATINAYEAELESRVLANAETDAMNARLLDEVARLSSLLSQQTNARELEEFLEQMRSETDWYKTIAKGYEAELKFLQNDIYQCAEDDDDDVTIEENFSGFPAGEIARSSLENEASAISSD